MATFREVLDRIKQEIRETSASDVKERLSAPAERRPVVIDVRERDEFVDGHVPGAEFIPRGLLDMKIEGLVPDREQPIVLYCAGGTRSALAARTLQELGYANVESMTGGFGAWKGEGYDFTIPKTLNQEQMTRYSRHLIIPEVGEAGQTKLLESRVLMLGAGGLGSPAGLYLAAAGVGTLGIIDSDVVDRSNLQRQVLHTDDRVGVSKVESARQTINSLNPDVEVVGYQERLTRDNAFEIFEGWDLILDGGDNFPTRYLINDASVQLGMPIVHGSVYRFEGQVTTFVPGQGPCYRCLYPEPPPPEFAPSCQEAGVLGVLPGIIGLLQATEAVKVILGIGEPLVGRLLKVDALKMSFREYRLRRDPECSLCREGATFEGLPDYQVSCSIG